MKQTDVHRSHGCCELELGSSHIYHTIDAISQLLSATHMCARAAHGKQSQFTRKNTGIADLATHPYVRMPEVPHHINSKHNNAADSAHRTDQPQFPDVHRTLVRLGKSIAAPNTTVSLQLVSLRLIHWFWVLGQGILKFYNTHLRVRTDKASSEVTSGNWSHSFWQISKLILMFPAYSQEHMIIKQTDVP